ncbi:MAG: conserved hypothetical protein, membrane [Candidatus Syntrophoarchaeum caldarius]|uniref:Exosortase H n=1 Tax=Candidatus Syntropharchaeum caldarium TaxID=1838285 RepID=A0A1F2PAI8_9EURY|nr:MAG: conserved hypothetical protein, membrane [Candidatus Syntrophoarchaeum caldarius]
MDIKAQLKSEPGKFIISFVIVMTVLYGIFYTFRDEFLVMRVVTAILLGSTLTLIGMDTTVSGDVITTCDLNLKIIDECTAVFSIIVYIAAIIAYPANTRSKIIGVVSGIPVLYGFNILRLVVLALVGVNFPGAFDFVHVYLWQTTFIIFVLITFLLWLKVVVERRENVE